MDSAPAVRMATSASQPLIGVLCNPVWNSKQGTLRATDQLASLEKLVLAASDKDAQCFLFRIQDVNFLTEQIKGYSIADGSWQQTMFTFPDAIYDQLISRRLERTEALAERRTRLSKLFGERIFNDGFFDKWQVHEWLMEDPRLRSHIPKTIRYSSPQAAAVFVQRNATTYLKPIHGSLGLGIVRLACLSDGTIAYDVKRTRQTPLHGKVNSAVEAVRIFRSRLRARPYLVQEGIHLVTYEDRPFDIRILLQRDGTGAWRRTKMFARVAREGDITSNLSSGGDALPIDTVLASICDTEAEVRRCRQHIQRIVRLTVDAMEHQSRQTFGELGIDLGLDTRGGLWVIEVNRPSCMRAATGSIRSSYRGQTKTD